MLLNADDDVLREVQRAIQVAARHVEQQPEVGGHAACIPDMGDRRGQFDVSHALTAHGRTGHLDVALVADDALVANLLVFTAVALIILGRAKDCFVEQTIAFGAQPPVVDGFRF